MNGLLTTEEARDVLEHAHGIALAARTLANLRSTGGGPPYVRVRKYVRYHPDDLRKWAQDQIRHA